MISGSLILEANKLEARRSEREDLFKVINGVPAPGGSRAGGGGRLSTGAGLGAGRGQWWMLSEKLSAGKAWCRAARVLPEDGDLVGRSTDLPWLLCQRLEVVGEEPWAWLCFQLCSLTLNEPRFSEPRGTHERPAFPPRLG